MYLHEVIEDMHQGINTVADKVVYQETGIPIIQSKNFTKGFLDLEDVRYLGVEDEEEYSSKYNPHVGDILMANIGTIGKSYVIKEEQRFLIAWNAFLIKPKKECICPDFLKYYFDYLATSNYFDKLLTGGTVKFINKKKIGEILIPNCSMKEQTEIVQVLSKIEQVIIKRQQQLEMLDNFIKSRFVEMFGDVRLNPNGYQLLEVGDLISSCEAGWSGNGTQRERKENEIAVLKVSSVTRGYFIPEECKVLDDQENIKKYVSPEKGDLIFSRANTREMVGATAIILEDYPKLILPDKLWKIRFIDDVNVFYMKYVLSSKCIREQFSAASTGTSGSMFNVSMEKFRNIEVPVAPLDMQNEFENFVHQVTKLKFL